jgi:ornithine cyclodeaminase/alanine dehydrogenase-like protein (mu-crystallin family)
MPPLLLKNEDMSGLVSVEELIDPMEEAFREHGAGEAPDQPRERLYVPLDERTYWFQSMMGAVPSIDVTALRLDSAQFVKEEGRKNYVGDFTGLVLLFSIQKSELIAILDDHYLSPLRVAATAAVGARYQAPDDSRRMGVFGTGEQSRAQVRAFHHICGFEEIVVFSPTEDHRYAFASEFDDELSASVTAVDDPERVVRGSDVVLTATNATAPVFDGEWLEPGTHVSTTVNGDTTDQRDEIDTTAVRKADRIFCQDIEKLVSHEQGSIYELIETGELLKSDITELGELVLGNAEGRDNDEQITIMKPNCGMGLQFAVTGSVILNRARERGVGTEIPADWFVTRRGEGENWSP